MSRIVAFAGKGGTGKTTVASLTMRSLVRAGATPVLGVDADPNSCLGEMLGAGDLKTIGGTRERFAESSLDIPPGVTRESVFQMMISEIIHEGHGWDLLVMGRPEGPGCYCFVNNILRKFLETLGGSYRYVVIDHEAGMEHLSRQNTGRADFLFIVAEPTISSLRAARRINDLSIELGLSIRRRGLVINKIEGAGAGLSSAIEREIEATGLEVVARLPFDAGIERAELEKKPFMDLGDDLAAVRGVDEIIELIRQS